MKSILKQEAKICLPVYKIVYSLCFVVILSLIRGISSVEEIGITLDGNIALLALVFCAETYVMERSGKRWEVFSLYPIRKRRDAVIRRLVIQIVFLCLLAYLGYFFFFWQKPVEIRPVNFFYGYGLYAAAVTVTIFFWSILSMTIANLFRNPWAGIGISLVIWLAVNSKFGEETFGKFSIFAYTFRDFNHPEDLGWLWGKALGVILILVMMGIIPLILKKRG